MAKTLFIVNDAPCGTERSYNALRLAGAVAKRDGEEVKIFLIGDASACAKAHQKVPQGFYNLEVMLKTPCSSRRRGRRLRELHGRPRYRGCRTGRGRQTQHAR